MHFRPSQQVLLYLRLDEMGDEGPLRGALPVRERRADPSPPAPAPRQIGSGTAPPIEQRLADLNETIRQVERLPEEAFAPPSPPREFWLQDLRRQREGLIADAARPASQPRPETLVGTAPDNRFVRAGVLPRRSEIERNGFRTADTATIVLDWSDVPFDPRLVRAAGVELVLGVVDPQAFEDGIRGASGPTGQLTSVVAQTPGGPITGSSTRFVGWVDTWTVEYAEGGDTVTLECRDFTALFLDQNMARGSGINLALPIDQGIRDFLADYPSVAGIQVVWGDVNDTAPGPVPVPGAAVPRARQARRGRVTRQTRSGNNRMSLWDHITDVCVALGVVPLIRGYELRIARPRTLFTSSEPRPRRMVYGRNLDDLQFTRKLSGVKVPTIEVRCYDPGIARTRWGRWPTRPGDTAYGILGVNDPPSRPARANDTGVSGARPDEDIQTYNVRSITDGARLAQVARSLFEQIGRQEIEGNLTTHDVGSYGATVPDLLGLEAGEALELLVAPRDSLQPQNVPLTAGMVQALSRRGRVQYLQRLGWDPEVAERFAALQDATAFNTIFRVQNSRITMDADEGLEIKVDFVNFITVREEQPGAADAVSDQGEQTPSARVERLTRGRTDEVARAARAASAARRLLETLRDAQQRAGLPTDAFDRRIAEAVELERQRLRDLEGQ